MAQAIESVIAIDYQGNPQIKITKDKPKVTFDVYTEDINYLKANAKKVWGIIPLDHEREDSYKLDPKE